MSTQAQRDYLDILLNDAGYSNRLARNDFVSLRAGRTIGYLDQLTTKEASEIISELKGEDE